MSKTRQQLLDAVPDYDHILDADEIAIQHLHPSHVWTVAEYAADCFYDSHADPRCKACYATTDVCINDEQASTDAESLAPCASLLPDGHYQPVFDD